MAPHRVLMLGSGFVAKPALDILTKAGIEVTVACRNLQSAQSLCEGVDLAKAITLDVADANALDGVLAQHDLVISLVPYRFHPAVIKSAIRLKKHVVTTSYVSPLMRELDQQAKDAGITVMNEIGLDPGIDHLYAVKVFERVHQAGGKIKSFMSYCGGLPAPEDANNPLSYKFSWSPRGSIGAMQNDAKFYLEGKTMNVAGSDLMASAEPTDILPEFQLVQFGNRDSTTFREYYNIPEAETVLRGTLRYPGFPEFIKAFRDIGFLSDKHYEFLTEPISWNVATQKLLNAASTSEGDLLAAIATKTLLTEDDGREEKIITGLKWLGILSDTKITPKGNPFDTLCALLETKMSYEKGERDLVLLQHRFGIVNKDGSEETLTSTLVEYGAPYGSSGYSAMARLVGTPCAVAVKQVLDGTLSERGVLAPLSGRINDPLIRELRDIFGIEMREEVVTN